MLQLSGERYKEKNNKYAKNIWERQSNVERTAMKSESLDSFSKLPPVKKFVQRLLNLLHFLSAKSERMLI